MHNKRGQDLSITTLILIVIGIVVAVIIILGFSMGWDYIFGKFKLAPGQDLQAVGKGCEISAQAKLKIDYCGLKEIKLDGIKNYVNCEDPRIKGSIDISGTDPITCGNEALITKCSELLAAAGGTAAANQTICEGKTAKVNNVPCKTYIADQCK
jgi:hypothetical protein